MHLYELNEQIYNKYYEGAKKAGIIWTLQDYFERENPDMEESAVEELCESHPHRSAIQKVLAYEVTYWVYRHLNGPWGEMIDFFLHERNRFSNEYRRETGYQVIGNDDESLS